MTSKIVFESNKAPLKWRIRRFIKFYIIDRLFVNPYYALKYRFFYKFHLVKTSLNGWRYHDADERLLYAAMDLFIDFLDKEKPFQYVKYETDVERLKIYNTMRDIEAWWKDYPNRLKEIDAATSDWYDYSTKSELKDKDLEKRKFEDIDLLENCLQKEEQEMLKKLIDIRFALWT
jgi:hypothetical protein